MTANDAAANKPLEESGRPDCEKAFVRPDPHDLERRAVLALETFAAARAVGERGVMVELDVAQTFDPASLIGREIGVYWPGEDAWFMGRVGSFEGESSMRHRVDYADGTVEKELLAAERVKIFVPLSPQFAPAVATLKSMREYASTLVLEAVSKSNTAEVVSLRLKADNLRERAAPRPFPPRYGPYQLGDVVLGLNRGYPPWPAMVVTWEQASNGASETEKAGKFENLVPLLYFDTYQRQLLRSDRVLPFGRGFTSSKVVSKALRSPNRPSYWNSFEEALNWLSKGTLPEEMLPINGDDDDEEEEVEDEDEDEKHKSKKKKKNSSLKGRIRPRKKDPDKDQRNESKVRKAVRQWQTRYSKRISGSSSPLPIKVSDMARRGVATIEVLCLGRIEWLHPGYHTKECLWPVGYTAIRYTSDSALCLEICETPDGSGPNFRIFGPEGLMAEARSPAEAWLSVEKNDGNSMSQNNVSVSAADQCTKTLTVSSTVGAREFGLCNSKVQKELIKLPGAERCENFKGDDSFRKDIQQSQLLPQPHSYQLTEEETKRRLFYEAAWLSRLPSGHHGPHVKAIKWLPPGAGICAVCLEEEEDEEDLIVQCDKCGIFVHMLCYAVKQAPHGRLWLCDVCLIGASNCPPACALCPVIGGPLKRSECGRWVHPTCALWIDGPALEHDVAFGGVLDGLVAGLTSIHPSAFKVTCTICNQNYGACVQCCHSTCYATFHIMCARQQGCRMRLLMDEEKPIHQTESHTARINSNGNGNGKRKRRRKKRRCEGKSRSGMNINGARLVVYCPKHSKTGKESEIASTKLSKSTDVCSHHHRNQQHKYTTSGEQCLTKMESGLLPAWQEESQSPALKLRLDLYIKSKNRRTKVVSKQPIPFVLATGPILPFTNSPVVTQQQLSISVQDNGKGALLVQAAPVSLGSGKIIPSISERYEEMRLTLPRRVVPCKSSVHGWGALAKERHYQDQMVIEYVGDLVRPSVADAREAALYNSMVGAGTYIFRLNADYCVDATRAGNLAHLLNHSCNPNCYSRTVPVWDTKLNRAVDHVIIFALRDIDAWEELTYDYRFSGDERLTCSCGAPTCRGVVNQLKTE